MQPQPELDLQGWKKRDDENRGLWWSHKYPNGILSEDSPFRNEKWDMRNVKVTLILTPAATFQSLSFTTSLSPESMIICAGICCVLLSAWHTRIVQHSAFYGGMTWHDDKAMTTGVFTWPVRDPAPREMGGFGNGVWIFVPPPSMSQAWTYLRLGSLISRMGRMDPTS